MIYYEYFFDQESFITGWKSWNANREKDNIDYQEKMELIKNNPKPTKEMNESEIYKGRIYNNETENWYKLNNDVIETVPEIKNGDIAFNKKYTLPGIINIIGKGIDNKNDIEYQELLTDVDNLIQEG